MPRVIGIGHQKAIFDVFGSMLYQTRSSEDHLRIRNISEQRVGFRASGATMGAMRSMRSMRSMREHEGA
jgi:hypothetical protein